MYDPLLGDRQPTPEEWAAARRFAQRQAVINITSMLAIGIPVTWLILGEVAILPFAAMAVVMWLLIPRWTRMKIAKDRGDPPPRIY